VGKQKDYAANHSFAEYRDRYGMRGLEENEDIYDTLGTLRHVGDPDKTGEDRWVWKPGKPKEQTFDFAPFFPFDNGGEPPYFRQRVKVDRHEAGIFFEYREDGGTGDFEPWPLPTPERLEALAT
jgi:hypothetical protein